MKTGIDVSHHQGNIDWSKVSVDFAIIRAGYRGYGSGEIVEDEKARTNCTQANARNIPIGLYFFSQAVTEEEAREEAQFLLNFARSFRVEYPLYIDTELSGAKGNKGRADSLSAAQRTMVVKAFCEEIEKAGYYAGIYCSASWCKNNLSYNDLKAYDFWIAKWSNSEPFVPVSWGIWQHTNNDSVSGISTRVDADRAYKDYPEIIKKAGLNGFGAVKGFTFTFGALTGKDAEKMRNLLKEIKVSYAEKEVEI
jgi:GH25 family lysozyme M1 (1,4-beta-N-acetylmuramidase)